MLVTIFIQGCTRTSCPSDMFGACLLFTFEYLKHISQFKINFSNCSLVPNQYTVSLYWSLHFPRPKWPLCIICNISLHLLLGITIQVPFSISPSSIVSSSWNVQYACISGGTTFMELGHPFVIMCFNRMSSSSSWVAVHSWFNVSLLALSWLVIWFTYSFGNLMLSFWFPSLHRQSANWLLGPGMWHTVKWYGNVHMRILCNCSVARFKLFESIASSSFWSVSRMKWVPYMKWWKFSMAHTTTRYSSSITMYPFWVSVRALLAKYTGLPFCSRHAPSPLMLMSVYRTISLLGS